MQAGVNVLWRVTAPASTPVSLSEAKAQLRVDGTDEDAYITSLINVAVALVDGQGMLGKAMVTQTWGQALTGLSERVRVLMGPIQSLSAVKYFDKDGVEQTATLSNFEIVGRGDARYVRPKDGFDWPEADDRPDPIWIEYVTGYGNASDVPATVRHALLLLVAHWFEIRQAATFSAAMPIPFGVESLIGQERARWYG